MLNRNCLWLMGVLLLQLCSGCAMTQRADQQLAERQSLDAQLSLARLSERHGKLDFAKQIYQKALESSPESVVAHHRLAVIDARRGRLDEAEKHFKAAMKSGQPNVDLLSDYGYALYLKEDFKSAEQVLRQVVEREPRHTAARNNLALVLGEQGRFNESLKEFRMAVDEPEALANLAYVKTTMGEFEDAQKAYHRALELKGDMRPAAEALIQLAEVEGVIDSSRSLVDPKLISPPSPPSVRAEQVAATRPSKTPQKIKNVGYPARLPSSPATLEQPSRNNSQKIQLTSHQSHDEPSNARSQPRPLKATSVRESTQLAPIRASRRARVSQERDRRNGSAADAELSPRKPSFFPGSVSPRQIDSPDPNGTPTASKIEAAQPLSTPSFETSFVDDMHTEFPGGNSISTGQSFLEP